MAQRSGGGSAVAGSLIALGLLVSSGCGDDDSGPVDAGGGSDTGVENLCPTDSPDRDALMPPCCYRVSNMDRPAAPEFRMVNLDVRAPATLDIANPLVRPNIDREVTNWLFDFDIDGDQVTVTTGMGSREADGSFAFGLTGYDPGTTTGTVIGDVVRTDRLSTLLVIPLFDDDGVRLIVDLPLRSFDVVEATLSNDRTCIGERRNRSAWQTGGTIGGFVTLTDSEAQGITYGPLENTTLCMLMSGNGTTAGERCTDTARPDWPNPPDSLCDGGDPETCTEGACDRNSECNAWRIESGFAAAGVEIVD